MKKDDSSGDDEGENFSRSIYFPSIYRGIEGKGKNDQITFSQKIEYWNKQLPAKPKWELTELILRPLHTCWTFKDVIPHFAQEISSISGLDHKEAYEQSEEIINNVVNKLNKKYYQSPGLTQDIKEVEKTSRNYSKEFYIRLGNTLKKIEKDYL